MGGGEITVSSEEVFQTMTPVSNTGSSAAGATEGLGMKRKWMLLGWPTPELEPNYLQSKLRVISA